ncbi:flagellar P-ring protein precursor FlgI [Geopseudomonas sagittaria]|uniref:Flagellar P-ring protein n=1 Tax=Geopseudomonas sagittaria TaxID=1135990 RepID=A0A1I5QDH5_9GAMM|nr:flagellar basal body P-ring protein FlgI [Pseudomonas sagittaria]MCM2318457.1 flagellar basal body P-ring protein FlgI [Pseudomonas sp.]SFP44081.1 flagellar P-ring protein precursor FlgI [Pseudomonas sagittaria]
MKLSILDLLRPSLVLLGLLLGLSGAGAVQAERLRDLAEFAGVRSNALVGYGLVVGLDGSGDQTMQAPFTGQSLTNMLSQLGITVPPGTNMQLRNIAAVMVTAQLPAFVRPGQGLDVVVSSVGNARSLRGGTLLMTPLKGADGETYALAQGNLLVGGAGAEAGGSSVQINQQAGGRISRGATVEREVPLQLGNERGLLELQLKQPDFGMAQRMVTAINYAFGRTVASAQDGGLILLDAPRDPNGRVNFMARLESLDIGSGEVSPKVIINSRSGAVVLNGTVTLQSAAVAHGNLSVVIDNQPKVSQPAPFSEGQTVVVPDAQITVEQQGTGLRMVAPSTNLLDVVKALNALGATPQDLMSILEALKASGALRAELEII